jgi:hypothetical protein
LQRVAVARHDQHAVSAVLGLRGEGGDQVVGLEARLGEHGDAERAQHLLSDVDLSPELIRRGGPARLVLGVFVGAERLPGDIECRGDVGRLFIAQQVDQHRGKPVYRVGGQPALGLEVLRG